jgi:hypothetical protein
MCSAGERPHTISNCVICYAGFNLLRCENRSFAATELGLSEELSTG